MAFDLKKFLAKFVEEAREHLSKLNEGLVSLEKNPGDDEVINSVFRSAHTIKGSSRMMKLTHITEVSHKMEDVLGALREKKITLSKELADVLFKGLDAISGMVDTVAAGGEITADNTALCEEIAKAAEAQPQPATAEDNKTLHTTNGQGEAAESKGPDVQRAAEQTEDPKSVSKQAKAVQTETIRIKSQKLDDLIKLIGELVSGRNRFKQLQSDIKELESKAKRLVSSFGEPEAPGLAMDVFAESGRLASFVKDEGVLEELLISELQEKALSLRMVPLSTVFDPLHRMVRDFSVAMGKDVDLVIEGEGIELDRKMVEKLGDPLVHMVRNSIDHGIEPQGDRLRAGKPAKGTVRLSASYESGSVLIELADDGSGISLSKIKEKALKKNMYDEVSIESVPVPELVDLIFRPAFSTSAIITDVSGRGVGMDVVKKNIVEDLKGTIEVEAGEGRGASFRIRLPLTLAIMRILILDVSGTPFGINTHYVGEILRISESEMITVVDKKAIRLREEFIPVVKLGSLLSVAGNGKKENRTPLVVILQLGSEKLGVSVDGLLNEENVVIKTLPRHLKNIKTVSGVTISGRNEIINVLHVPALISMSRELREARPYAAAKGADKRTVSILVVDDSVNTREIEKSILEAYGYSVELADDGMDALNKVKKQKFDLIITDVEMPRLDGFSLTERLRADESYAETPIIIVTSREKEEDKRRGIAVGANAYIVKGAFDQANLLETVQNLVG